MPKGLSRFMGATVLILVLLLGLSIYTQGFSSLGLSFLPLAGKKISSELAEQKVVDYVVDNYSVSRDQISVNEVTEEKGLYKLEVIAQGNKVNSYLTSDGELFFPQGIWIRGQVAGETEGDGEEAAVKYPKSDVPQVKLFTMAFCPYGTPAEEALKPVAELLGEEADFDVHHVYYNYGERGSPENCLDDNNQYCSMHGIIEAEQGIRERCVLEKQPDKFWNYVSEANKCQNTFQEWQKDVGEVDESDVRECLDRAVDSAGVDENSLQSCYLEDKITIASQEVETKEQFGATGSPTLIINGVEYSGNNRTSEAYKEAVCSAFTEVPQDCEVELEDQSSGSGSASCGS